jgi:hypothetical protein
MERVNRLKSEHLKRIILFSVLLHLAPSLGKAEVSSFFLSGSDHSCHSKTRDLRRRYSLFVDSIVIFYLIIFILMGFINWICPSLALSTGVDGKWIFSHEVCDNLVAQVEVHAHPYR